MPTQIIYTWRERKRRSLYNNEREKNEAVMRLRNGRNEDTQSYISQIVESPDDDICQNLNRLTIKQTLQRQENASNVNRTLLFHPDE